MPAIFSDGDDFDKFVPEREWPDEALPSPPQPNPQLAPQPRSAPDQQALTASEATVHSLLKSHHLQADVLKSLGIDACAEYKKGKAAYYLSKVRKGDVMCPLCNGKCSNSQKLKNHIIARHQEVTTYQCATCGKSFSDSFTLKTHVQSHKKPSSTKRLKCRICGKRCDTASHLAQHERDHTGEGAPVNTVASIWHNLGLFLPMRSLVRRIQPTLKHPGRSNTSVKTAIRPISTREI